MYKIYFYVDKNGKEPVLEYLRSLAKKQGKDSRIKLNKIRDYIKILALYGTSAGEPYIKHLEDNIWEIRPLRDRILFVSLMGDSFVLLHHFVKKTRKTPQREIEKVKKEWNDLKEREFNEQEKYSNRTFLG